MLYRSCSLIPFKKQAFNPSMRSQTVSSFDAPWQFSAQSGKIKAKKAKNQA